MSEYYSVKECAAIMGTSENTIKNYVTKGFIPRVIRRRCWSIPKKEFDKFAKGFKPTCKQEAAIAKFKEELDIKEAEYKQKMKNLKFTDAVCNNGYRFLSKGMIKAYVSRIYKEDCVEKSIVFDILEGCSFEELAASYGRSRERIRQIYEKALKRLETYDDELDNLRRENLELKRRCAKQHERILLLQITKDKPTKEAERENALRAKCRKVELYNTELSVRALNCTRAIDVRNLEDLLTFTTSELLKCRNMGGKTVSELEDFVDEQNKKKEFSGVLKWGMFAPKKRC